MEFGTLKQRGQQALADEMMQNIKGIEAYHRLTFDVESKEFDDFSEKNIERLKEAARKAASSPEFAAAINTIVKARLERMKDPEPTLFTSAMKEAELKKEEIARQSGVNKT